LKDPSAHLCSSESASRRELVHFHIIYPVKLDWQYQSKMCFDIPIMSTNVFWGYGQKLNSVGSIPGHTQLRYPWRGWHKPLRLPVCRERNYTCATWAHRPPLEEGVVIRTDFPRTLTFAFVLKF
jgi:hypothetical protein